MVGSSQHHINSLISNKCNQRVGGANQLLDQSFTNSGIQTNNSNANYMFNHQICDDISRIRLCPNTSKISTELNLTHTNQSPESNLNENMHKSKSSYKKINKNFHDPSINTVITSSTLKYAGLAFISMFSICAYISFVVIGILGIQYCGSRQNIPIYLLAFGIAGIVHIFIYYSCPFNYSKSIMAKMYEHLVWRLIINRFSASLFFANHTSASLYENSDKTYSELSTCSKFNVKASCCSTFLISFFCCNFCCFRCCKGIIKKVNQDVNSNMQQKPSMNHLSETSLNLSRNLAQSNSNSSMAKVNASSISVSNSSFNRNDKRRKSTISNIESSSSNFKHSRSSEKIANFSFKRSKSSSELNQKRKKAHKRVKSLSENSLGNPYFNGRYGNKYSTHKNLYRHYKKTQQPIKIVDCHTMRFCIFIWIRQLLLLFLLIWFICGNYWVFNQEIKFEAVNINSTNKSSHKVFKIYFKDNEIIKSLNELKSNDLNPAVLKFVCYDFGFYQIIVIYCLFAFSAVIFVIFSIFHKFK